ncbi:MAG: hypothetical protein ACJ72N_10135 [Labedaea sp.]
MEATEQGGHADEHRGRADDWLAGAMIEFGGEIEEQTEVALDGIEFGSDETHVA